MISSVGQARAHCCTQCERSLGSSDDITKKGMNKPKKPKQKSPLTPRPLVARKLSKLNSEIHNKVLSSVNRLTLKYINK